ncbi:uncharacterized protein LOC144104352 [Amblyomma americanum]
MDAAQQQVPLRTIRNAIPLQERLPKGPWTKQLKDVPDGFSEQEILAHQNAHGAQKHTVSGYRMFKSEKVQNVLICKADRSTFVKATVEASFSLAKSYNTAAVLSSNGTVVEGTCNCRAGAAGVCKHVVALLWFLLDLKRSGAAYVRDTQSCTDKPRAWGTGAKKVNVHTREFSQLRFVKHMPMKAGRHLTQETTVSLRVTEDHIKRMHQTQKNIPNAMLCKTLEDNHFLPVPVKRTLHEEALSQMPIRLPVQSLWAEHVPAGYKFGSCELTLEDSWALEQATRMQSGSTTWNFERSKRLTASHFGDVVSRQKPADEKYFKRLFGSSQMQTKYMADGLRNEDAAVQRYIGKRTVPVRSYYCGLCVNPGVPVLGATPDRVVEEGGDFGLLEVKTLSAAKERGDELENAVNTASYLKNGVLKPTHKYFYQVQGQMALTGLSWCDFVVDNGTDCTFQRITFDSSLWISKMLPCLLECYKNYQEHCACV